MNGRYRISGSDAYSGDGNSDGELNLPISVAGRGGSNSGSVQSAAGENGAVARKSEDVAPGVNGRKMNYRLYTVRRAQICIGECRGLAPACKRVVLRGREGEGDNPVAPLRTSAPAE